MKMTSHEVSFILKRGNRDVKNRIKEYRVKFKMTQQELSEKVNVTSRTIISLEKGQYNPSLMLAYRIACIFDVTIEELYCLKENKKLEDLDYERHKK